MNSEDILSTLRRRIAKAPEEPGIYRWKNKEGDVLYVGKAKNLRSRLKSYVNKGAEKGQGPWKLSLLNQLADVDITVVNSELEALVLETNLIKQLRPKYNVLMKDGKNYVYVEVTVQDHFPVVDVVRQMANPKAKYFGPFVSAFDTKRSLDMLNELFGWRACAASLKKLNDEADPPPSVECLDYQIGQCCGTCAGVMSREEYRARIDRVMDFFKGNYKPVIDRARECMMEAAAEKKFEKATRLRDLLKIVEGMQERQIVSDTSGENVDVIGLALLSGKVQVVLMQKREGKLIGEQQFSLMGSAESIPDVLEQFLPQYYESAVDLPEAVIVGEDFPSRETFADYLTRRNGRKTKVIVPERGGKSRLLELAEKNAEEKAKQAEATWEADQRNTERALEELMGLLNLKAPPARIEGYDISHTGGTETVGSMVVFTDGKPRNDHYRSFTIGSMQRGAIDDYRSLKEVLTRRLRHAAGGIGFEEGKWNEQGIAFGKARKDEQPTVDRIASESGHDSVLYKDCLVARHDNEIVALACLHEVEKSVIELSPVWADETYRAGPLAWFLARMALRSLKKGKAYVCVPPELEQQFASVGFRHVIKPPKAFAERCAAEKEKDPSSSDRVTMVYDSAQHKPDVSLSAVPDLIVIDGGKGQLGVGVEVLAHFGLGIPVIGLAKREEEVFVPGNSVSLMIPQDSPAKFMLMRLRDEAHRFANRHRSARAKRTAFTSQLDSIPSIGPETKQKLLQAFGSVDTIKRQTDETLLGILTQSQIEEMRKVL